MRPVALVVSLLLVLAVTTSARAEINIADSIEWMTADSDLVVRGTVTSVTPKKVGTSDWTEVTLAPTDALKGKRPATIAFVYWGDGKRWLASKAELLVFLVDAKRLPEDRRVGRRGLVLRGGNEGETILNLSDRPRAYTAAFGELSTRDTIVAAVRASAGSSARASHRLDVPSDTPAYKALYGGSAVWLHVPVDAALERRAIDWLASKRSATREDGVRALLYFRSRANVSRVKALLRDRDTAVRKAAHDVMTEWKASPSRARQAW